MDSTLVSIMIENNIPERFACYEIRYSNISKWVKLEWTFGELSAIISSNSNEEPLMLPARKKDFDSSKFVDQLEFQEQVEFEARKWLSKRFGLTCMEDCGDIGYCKSDCTQYPGYEPRFQPHAKDRYRPKGTLRVATPDELKELAFCAYRDCYRSGTSATEILVRYLIQNNLTASDDDIAKAIDRERTQRGR
jgi:hypothetical protein